MIPRHRGHVQASSSSYSSSGNARKRASIASRSLIASRSSRSRTTCPRTPTLHSHDKRLDTWSGRDQRGLFGKKDWLLCFRHWFAPVWQVPSFRHTGRDWVETFLLYVLRLHAICVTKLGCQTSKAPHAIPRQINFVEYVLRGRDL